MNKFKAFSLLKILLLATALLWLPYRNAGAQIKDVDYQNKPLMPYDFIHLKLDLSLDINRHLLGGTASYQISPRLNMRDTLLLHAAHMDINRILWQGQEAEYTLSNDSILITPPPALQRTKQYLLEIVFEKKMEFGVLRNFRGTIWSSLLPKTQRHWFPVFDHPRNSFTTDISLTTDSSKNAKMAVFSGTRDDEGRWKLGTPVPATAIGFAMGQFETSETLAGRKTINLVSEKGLLNAQQKSDLLDTAYSVLMETQKAIGMEFPFQSFDLVILEDHHWEQKQYAAGMGYIFMNNGDLKHQIRQVIQAQWMGIQHREEQWVEAESIRLLQAWLYAKVFKEDSQSKINNTADTPESSDFGLYNKFSIKNWQHWLYSYQQWEKDTTRLTQAIELHGQSILEESETVHTWHSLGDILYQRTGYLWEHRPLLSSPQKTDTLEYRAEFLYDDLMSDLKIVFSAKDSAITSLVSTELRLEKGDGVEQKQVVFTGQTDTVDVDFQGSVRNASLIPVDSLPVIFNEEKPAMFWLYQLRESERAEHRAEAAEKLKNHTDNPDLQLALLDFMNRELAPPVEAALLQTLAVFTNGAVGTEQQFLKALSSSHKNVQLAAINALKNYPDNQQVENRVERLISNNEDADIIKKSLHVYAALTNKEQFNEQANRLMASDTTGTFVPNITNIMITLGDTTRAVSLYKTYSGLTYSYSVRQKMLDGLQKYASYVSNWQQLINQLMDDPDPRIRYLGIGILASLDTEKFNADELLQNRLPEEYDARVHQRIVQYLHLSPQANIN